MSKCMPLLLALTLHVEIVAAVPRQQTETPADAAMRWRAWRAPTGGVGTRLSPADAALRVEAIRRYAEEHFADLEDWRYRIALEGTWAFPLTGELLAGRAFWAVWSRDSGLLVVYERRGNAWIEVTQYSEEFFLVTDLGPVAIESSYAWILLGGGGGRGGLPPVWVLLRFNGTALVPVFDLPAFEIMIADVDLDGGHEILSRHIAHVDGICDCGVTTGSFGLHRWNGARMADVGLERLPAGAASGAAVAANARAVTLARARRWAEAIAVLDENRAFVAEHSVFRRNASLIDLRAAGPEHDRLSEDLLLHYVFAGLWADAVDLFRTEPVAPDFFATRPPSIPDIGSYGTPAYLEAVFGATAAARTVAPARAEIEFLHAWAAFHLDPDTTTLDLRGDWYRPRLIDSDDATVLDGLDHAVRLAPDDPLFAEAQRLVADRMR